MFAGSPLDVGRLTGGPPAVSALKMTYAASDPPTTTALLIRRSRPIPGSCNSDGCPIWHWRIRKSRNPLTGLDAVAQARVNRAVGARVRGDEKINAGRVSPEASSSHPAGEFRGRGGFR